MQRSRVSLWSPERFAREDTLYETYNGLHIYLLWVQKDGLTELTEQKAILRDGQLFFRGRGGQFPNNNSRTEKTAGKTSCRGSHGKNRVTSYNYPGLIFIFYNF